MSAFTTAITPGDVAELIDLTVEGRKDTQSMATLQTRGVAALHNILCDGPVAYLADEVGMGKTYQAMGLAAILWNLDPSARILFISPRQNLQLKWERDYRRFFAQNYRRGLGGGDDLVASALFNEPVHRPTVFHTLRSWTPTIGRYGATAAFLRHPSFTRPLHFNRDDADDLEVLWDRLTVTVRRAGLFDVEPPKSLTPDNALALLQTTFAEAGNRLLAAHGGDRPYYDLVIVDEAQCLRNPDNQTNTVLHTLLAGQTAKWLFMSATPAHSGPGDIPTILNHYPQAGTLVDPGLAVPERLPELQEAVQPLMVRRTRRYLTNTGAEAAKREYRDHDVDGWAVADVDMTPLQSLAMGLVQKGLVDVVDQHGGHFKIGYLSSFESLSSSIRGASAPADLDDEEEGSSDHWRGAGELADYQDDSPDATFIDRLAGRFTGQFDRPLPHPKVEALVDTVARTAFGTDDEPGGHKAIVFTRRVSTVDALRDRLTQRWIQSIERRAMRYWGSTINWDQAPVIEPAVDLDAHPVDDATEEHLPADDSPFRQAMRPKGWLGRHLQRLEDTGSLNLLMEDGWLSRVCRDTGRDPKAVVDAIPQGLWVQSRNHSAHGTGPNTRLHRAERMRYLALHLLRERPDILGLDSDRAAAWLTAYETILHGHAMTASAEGEAEAEPRLVTEQTLWTAWDSEFQGTELALPAADTTSIHTRDLAAELCRRQVARTVLRQVFRLSDTAVDLYLADQRAQQTGGSTAEAFVTFAASNDPGAERLRREVANWLTHLRTII
uniref:DEAD/DEAH box helicase family protein n=1 Tax=Euzebya pacifica TaxID=1608957 RepID=UPI0030FAAC1F